MACALARQRPQLNVTLLLRDPYVCRDINERHINTRYLKVILTRTEWPQQPLLLNMHACIKQFSGITQEYTLPGNAVESARMH
jgi:glycerol-3-phosphate dehydrogenase